MKIKLTDKNFSLIKSGKRQTIRLGIKSFEIGDCDIFNIDTGDKIRCLITKIEITQLKKLDDEDAIKDGFKSVKELRRELKRIYSKIRLNDIVTVVTFAVTTKHKESK